MTEIDKSVLQDEMFWIKDKESDFVYSSKEERWKIKMNDFPEHSLYTLYLNNIPQFNFDDWPDNWDIVS